MKQQRLNFYSIDLKYVRNLSQKDSNVMSTSPQIHKSNRPFVGVIVLVNDRMYCVPLTSPKEKFENKNKTVVYKQLMANQLTWCQTNSDIIIKRANSLYNIITENADDNKYLAKRCCNFKKLEEVLDRYISKQKSPLSRNQIKKNANTISQQKHSPHSQDKSKGR